MNIVEYKQMAAMERFYWWHRGRNRLFEDQLKIITRGKKQRILNIGCGTGGTIPILEKFGEVVNVDTSKEVLKYLKQNGVTNTVLVKGLKLPFKDNEFDIVVGFDVLEHIEDEHAALTEWSRVTKPGGKLFITVPAYQWLWSEHDVSLHHFRRYTRSRLSAVVREANFVPNKLSYAIAFSLPMVVGFRFLKKLKPGKEKKDSEVTSYVKVPNFINSLFSQALYLESRLLKHISFFFGTSVFTIADNNKFKRRRKQTKG